MKLTGTAPFAKVHIIKNNQYVYSTSPSKATVDFTKNSNFLYLFISCIIVGSILGMDRHVLVKGFLKIFVPLASGTVMAALVGTLVGSALGLGWKHTLFFIVETDDVNALHKFLWPGFERCTSTITPVSEVPAIPRLYKDGPVRTYNHELVFRLPSQSNIGDLASNSPWSNGYPSSTLTLANTFLGRVILRNRPSPNPGTGTSPQTIVVNNGLAVGDSV